MATCYLTTVDNNYDPSIDYDAWLNEDMRLGYDCCGKLARMAEYLGWNEELPDEKQEAIIEDAIDLLISIDFLSIFRKIKKENT